MADSAPETSAERQSVGAHHRIGMRQVAQLAMSRPATTTSVIGAFLLLTLYLAIASASPQQYIVCIEVDSHRCLTFPTEFKDDVASAKELDSNANFACFTSTTKPYPGHQQLVTVTPFNGSTRRIFCKSIRAMKALPVLDETNLGFGGFERVRRDASYSPRGRYRGQTQSQYLAIDRGGGKDEGKAEAHSAADSSRATVTGNSGMGQAQSQSMYDPSCEECVGRTDLGAESLKRRPGEQSVEGTLPGSAGFGNGPNGSGGIGPGQIVDPRTSGQGMNPNQVGSPGGTYGGRYYPSGSVGFGPGRDSTQGGSTGNIPGGNINGLLGPHSQTGYGINPDGTTLGIRPQITYNPNGNNNGLGGNNIGNHPGSVPGTSLYGSGQPGIIEDGTHGSGKPGMTGTYTDGPQGGNANVIPGNQGFSPGGTIGGGNIPPSSLTQPHNVGGGYGPNQNVLPNNNGIYPIQGGSQNGITGPSGAYPGGSNWPTVSGSFVGPDGLNYYCCVANPNGPQLGGSSFKPPGAVGLPNQYPQIPPTGVQGTVGQFGPGVGGSHGSGGQYVPGGSFVPGSIGSSSGEFGPGSGGQYGSGTGGNQGNGGLLVPGGGGQGTGGQFVPGSGGAQSPGGQYGPGVSRDQFGPRTTTGQGTGGPLAPGGTGGQIGPGSHGGQFGLGPGSGVNQGTGGQFVPTGGSGTGGQYGPGVTDGQGGPYSQYGPDTSGKFGPGIGRNTGLQYGPGSGGGPGGNYAPGTGSGTGGQHSPGTGSGTGGQYGPDTGSGTGGQYGPGTGSGTAGHYAPGTGRGTGGQYGPGTGSGTGGQYAPGTGGGTGGQYGPGTGGGTGGQYAPGAGGGTGRQYAPGAGGGTGGQYDPGTRGGAGGQYAPGTGGGTGGQYGPGTGGGASGQYAPGTGGGTGGQYAPGTGGGTGGQYAPGTGGGTGGQFAPGTGGGTGGQYVPGAGSGTVGQYAPGTGGGTGGQYGPGAGSGTREHYGPGTGSGTGGQYSPGTGSGTGGQYGPGTGSGTGGQYGPGTGSGTGGQYGPGTGSGTGGQYGPGTGSGTSGQYGPGTGSGTGGQYGPGTRGGAGGQYAPGTGGGTGGQYGPGTGGGASGQYAPGTGGGTGGQYGPSTGGDTRHQLGPGSGNSGQYGPGTGISTGGQFIPGGQYGPLAVGGQGNAGQFSPGTGGYGGQFIPGVGGSGQGTAPGGQFGPGSSGGQYGPSGNGGQFGPGAGAGSGNKFGPGSGSQYGPGAVGGQGSDGQFGPSTGEGAGGQYGPGTSGGTGGQYVPGAGGAGGQYGPDASGGRGPGGTYNPYNTGGLDNLAGSGGNQNGVPQNVIDPNSIADGDDSEAEASVNQAANGTVASASSKGGNEKGRAQTHVHGTYTDSGTFSAQAEITGEDKAASSQVTGNKKSASSTAQGSGRNNKSQANVELGLETGSVVTGSQSEGVLHSSNSQVQGSIKGGMADAQAKGPGSTSSQAQIGFTPYKEGDKSHDTQKTPFVGGGISSAQSSGRTGMSQSQLHGTFKYGITYNGAAQAGSSLDKDAVFPNRLPFDKIDVNDQNNKNINVDDESVYNSEKVEYSSSVPPTESPTTELPFETDTVTELNKEEPINQPDDPYGIHRHADHHTSNDPLLTPTRSPPVESRRSFQSTYNTNAADYEYTTDKDDNPPEDYDVDDGFGPEGNDPAEAEQGYMNTNYNEFSRDPEPTHQSLHSQKRKDLEVRQTTGGNTQHILLGTLTDHDAEITQQNSERPDESRIYQPGERIPGTGGYTIPKGFTGSVKSVASKDKTYVVGSKESPSQAQTVSLTPGSGRVKYKNPPYYAKNVNPKNLRSLYNSKSDDSNRYVSVSKSVTRSLDGENNVRKQYSHTYYTKSSSCGYFTFSCTMVSGAEGKKTVCKPKMPTNPDGSPMRCN